jgi:hypothetical protein
MPPLTMPRQEEPGLADQPYRLRSSPCPPRPGRRLPDLSAPNGVRDIIAQLLPKGELFRVDFGEQSQGASDSYKIGAARYRLALFPVWSSPPQSEFAFFADRRFHLMASCVLHNTNVARLRKGQKWGERHG